MCGNVVHDVVAHRVDEPLRWGNTTLIEHIGQHLGGNAANTSYTLAKLGCAVDVLTLIGDDASGAFVRERLRAAGVGVAGAYTVSLPTSMALCLVNAQAERALLYQLGASGGAFPEPFTLTAGVTHFHLAAVFRMPYLRTHAPRYLQFAKQRGLTTSADTQWDTESGWLQVLAPSLPYIDLLFVNQDEGEMLTGTRDPQLCHARLIAAGAKDVVIKLGAQGCFASGSYIPGFAVDAVDTTGAGDCFVGAFLAAQARGMSRHDAARAANATGALSVLSRGATDGVRSWSDTQEWIAQHA